MDYKSDLIYPEIKIKEKNIEFAKKLLDLYCGKYGIINNILTHLYQASILELKYSDVLEKIIDVEILHVKIISKLIFKLGFKPKYIYNGLNSFKYYNTSYINYENDPCKIFEIDLNMKKEYYNLHNYLINETDDINIKEILNRLLLDEKLHIKIFKEILTSTKNIV